MSARRNDAAEQYRLEARRQLILAENGESARIRIVAAMRVAECDRRANELERRGLTWRVPPAAPQ